MEIGFIAQELVWVERLSIKLFIKILPVIEYYICTSYRASSNFCRGNHKKLAGIGQYNVMIVISTIIWLVSYSKVWKIDNWV